MLLQYRDWWHRFLYWDLILWYGWTSLILVDQDSLIYYLYSQKYRECNATNSGFTHLYSHLLYVDKLTILIERSNIGTASRHKYPKSAHVKDA